MIEWAEVVEQVRRDRIAASVRAFLDMEILPEHERLSAAIGAMPPRHVASVAAWAASRIARDRRLVSADTVTAIRLAGRYARGLRVPKRQADAVARALRPCTEEWEKAAKAAIECVVNDDRPCMARAYAVEACDRATGCGVTHEQRDDYLRLVARRIEREG